MPVNPLVIGSGNSKKARELAKLLQGLPWEVKNLRDFPPVEAPEETGDTFEENAGIKARFYAGHCGIPCLADDSGLVVDALDGAPGVYSSRYGGEEGNDALNNAKLMDALLEVPWPERTARFVCCAAFCEPGGEVHLEWGKVEGHIAMEPFGNNGFGYDPLFVPLGHDRTFGEMPSEKKHGMSHRGAALSAMRAYLESLR